MPDKLLNFLKNILDAENNEIYKVDGILNPGDLMSLYKIEKRDLKYEGYTPRISSYFREEEDAIICKILSQIIKHHVLHEQDSEKKAFFLSLLPHL